METSKFMTTIGRDGTIELPIHVLEKVDPSAEYEIVIRPMKPQPGDVKSVDDVIQHIEKSMNQRYPKLKTAILPRLKEVIGISTEIPEKYAHYSDSDIIGMAKMEKHLEKGEILENLC